MQSLRLAVDHDRGDRSAPVASTERPGHARQERPDPAESRPEREYRGPATLTAPGVSTVNVDAYLVARSDCETGLRSWRGRVTPVDETSMLTLVGVERIQVHVAGSTADMTIDSLGEFASEILGCGSSPF